jgi:ribonucleotide reductase alpha subunit
MTKSNNIITKTGLIENIRFEKVQERLSKLSDGLNVDHMNVAIKTISGIYDGITTEDLDLISERIAANSITKHHDYDKLAVRILVDRLHQHTTNNLVDTYVNCPVSEEFVSIISNPLVRDIFQSWVDDNVYTDYEFDYLSLGTMKRSYLLKKFYNDIVELEPRHRFYNIQQNLIKYNNYSTIKEHIKNEIMTHPDISAGNANVTHLVDTIYKMITIKKQHKIIERPVQLFLRCAIFLHSKALFDCIRNSEVKYDGYYSLQESIDIGEKRIDKIMALIYDSFKMMISKQFIHATPTLFNSGTKIPQLASCFLLYMGDSIESITDIFSDVSKISKMSGGVGIALTDVRAEDSYISTTGGTSNGILPIMRTLNELSRLWNQGGKRKGSFVTYIEPWHADIKKFINSRLPATNEKERCDDLFLGLWVPDLFMECVINNRDWYLMCPNECKGLSDVCGEEFEQLYNSYVFKNMYRKKVNAREVFSWITHCQIETGVPYILFKDQCNKKSNQKNLGVIKCSNLCAEIIEYTSETQHAVCNLSNICLGHVMKSVIAESNLDRKELLNYRHIMSVTNNMDYSDGVMTSNMYYGNNYGPQETRKVDGKGMLIDILKSIDTEFMFGFRNYESVINTETYDEIQRDEFIEDLEIYMKSISEKIANIKTLFYTKIYNLTKTLVTNLDNAIDINLYPVDRTRTSNLDHRPIGIGVQGLANVFLHLAIPFTCDEAKEINRKIFATMYYSAVEQSHTLAMERGSYISFANSPISQGLLQPHLWDIKTEDLEELHTINGKLDWNELIEKAKKGVRNSLLLSNMPTQSTSHIMGQIESIEPITQLMFLKKTLAGEFQCFNESFQNDMDLLGLWSDEMRTQIVANRGSAQNLNISNYLKEIYKVIWEVKQTAMIDMDADRGAYICQSQSCNRYLSDASNDKIYTLIKKAYDRKLKTACYYLRSKSVENPIKYSIDTATTNNVNTLTQEAQTLKVLRVTELTEKSQASENYKRWLAESRKAAESGEICTACQ